MDLKENCTYVMHNFKVLKNNGQYRVCDHQFKLVFIGVIVVRECVLGNIPFRKYRFVGFADVVAGQFERGLLVGSYPALISNSFKASKLIINQPVMEIQEFNERLAELGIEARSGFKSHGEGSTQLSGSIQLSSKESIFGKAKAETIADINTISELAFSAIKKVMQRWRPLHVHAANTIRKYRLEVMINQGNESTKFLLWDRECSELIGQSADAVNKLKIEDGDVDLNASPQALDKLLGHELAFKIKVQPKFRNSAFLKCSADSSLINVVMDMLADAEQSLSVTVDHDPLLGLPLTPTKRQAFQDCDDEAGTSQISPAQLSSNKLKKHAGI
ncbi:hypothetical protein JHK87_031793 [Glycine soja]|nr:hypothetical protein JHK87_031793 [Glycine soja]